MNVSSTDNFTPDPHPYLLSNQYYHLCLLLHQAVNVSSIDRSTNRRFCLYPYLYPIRSLFIQTLLGVTILALAILIILVIASTWLIALK